MLLRFTYTMSAYIVHDCIPRFVSTARSYYGSRYSSSTKWHSQCENDFLRVPGLYHTCENGTKKGEILIAPPPKNFSATPPKHTTSGNVIDHSWIKTFTNPSAPHKICKINLAHPLSFSLLPDFSLIFHIMYGYLLIIILYNNGYILIIIYV